MYKQVTGAPWDKYSKNPEEQAGELLVCIGVVSGEALRSDVELGLFGCVGVCWQKEHQGREKNISKDEERRGLAGQRSVFSR